MKKVLVVLLIILLSCSGTKLVFAESGSYVKVIYSSINIYSDSNIETSNVIKQEIYGVRLKLKSNEKIIGQDNFSYYLVELENFQDISEGYVFCSQVLPVQIASPNKDLDYNASVKNRASVFVLVNTSYEPTSHILEINQEIKILDGYNQNKEFTRIQYKDEDGDIITAYIKTEDILVSGISRTTIGALIIIVTTISLVLVLFGVKGKKKKKRA